MASEVRVDDRKGLELTGRQRLIWTEQSLAPAVPANNMVMSFTIEGNLDTERFRQAFGRVVEECEVLRTVIESVDDSPQRFFSSAIDRVLETVDLSQEVDPERALMSWRDERSVRPFDLGRQLFDSVLVRLEPRRVVWYLAQHHLICDAWSFSLLFERTAELYEDLESPPQTSQRGLVVKQLAAEKAYLASDRHEADETFWAERFARPIETFRPYGVDPSKKRAAIRSRTVALGRERSDRARRLAENESPRVSTPALSLSLLFTTALYAFLHRVSGNEVLGIGTPVANRSARWTKRCVGLFMEICPQTVTVEAGETFRSLHAKAAAENLAVLPHSRATVGNPVHKKRYDAMLNFHNASIRDFAGRVTRADLCTGLSGRLGEGGSANEAWVAGESLTVHVFDFEGSGDLRLGFDFNADLFGEEQANRAIEHFVNLFDQMLLDPEMRIDAAAILTEAERSGNDTMLVGPGFGEVPLDRRSVLERFRAQALAHPDRVALVVGEQEHTYGAMDAAIRSLGAAIRRNGVETDSPVAVFVGREAELPIALLGCHEAGTAYVPIDPDLPSERIRMILEDSQARLILTDSKHAEAIPAHGPARIMLDPGWQGRLGEKGPERRETEMAGGSDLAYVIYTSGSTGRPKGVEVEHSALANFMTAMARKPGFSETDRLLAVTTASFDIAALELFLPLTVGGSVEIASEETARDPRRLARRLASPEIDVMQATPATWRMLVDEGWAGRSSLRALCGGEALSRDLADALLERVGELWNLYGPTETTIWSTAGRVEPAVTPIFIGEPIDRTSLHILTPGFQPVPRGVPGELFIGGAGLARGYRGRADLTAERFLSSVLEGAGRIYQTGDRVRQHSDGRIEHLGRLDYQVKLRGFRLELGEIEVNLRACEEIKEAVVTAAGEAEGDRHLVAHVVPAESGRPDLESIAGRLRAQLPAYMVPTHWRVLDELPLTPNGKVDRATLIGDGAERIASRYDAPRDDLEIQISAIWRDVLGVDCVGRDDDFFDLGGNSLLAVEAVRRLKAALGREIPLATVFEHSSVEGLRTALSEAGIEMHSTRAVLLRPGDGDLPLFCIGGIHLYQALARAFRGSNPVYGVFVDREARWSEALTRGERSDAPETITTATECLAVIRTRQPHGPYRLAGLSYGGILAYEIARQLAESGETVEGLILLDVRMRRALRGAGGPIHIARRAARRLLDSALALVDRTFGVPAGARDRDRLLVEAVMRYEKQAKPYAGSVLLCRALDHAREEIDYDPTLGWAPLVQGELELADCPGSHLGPVEASNADLMAEQIQDYLDRRSA